MTLTAAPPTDWQGFYRAHPTPAPVDVAAAALHTVRRPLRARLPRVILVADAAAALVGLVVVLARV